MRRLVDAARLLPLFGGFLILLPILWVPGDTAARDTAPAGIYLFGVWAVLIVAAALLAPLLANAADTADAPQAGPRPSDAAPSDRAPSDAAPSDAAPSVAAPSAGAPDNT